MGRKAKLKQIQREAKQKLLSESPTHQADFAPTEFVEQLELQGYQIQHIARCPQLPDQRVNPQL
ncbi:MAG: hypothetical protein NVS2B14_20630 [Chamaesiphon sp.]